MAGTVASDLEQLVQKQKGSRKCLFFFLFKRKCCNYMPRSWAKHECDATLSNIKQRNVSSGHSKVQLEVISKGPPNVSRLKTQQSHIKLCNIVLHVPSATSAWRANSTIKAVKCRPVISPKLLSSRLGPFDLGLCTYCGIWWEPWLENYKWRAFIPGFVCIWVATWTSFVYFTQMKWRDLTGQACQRQT